VISVISRNVPICPSCKAGMFERPNKFGIHYVCHDCKEPWRVIDTHKSDRELVITNSNIEALAYIGGKKEL